MPWYFYKKNGSQKIEERDAELSGTIKMYAGGSNLTAGTSAEAMTAPPNFLYCNGAAVSIASFTDLYNAFGGTDKFRNGKTSVAGSFYLPDYRDNFPVGTSGTKLMSSTGGSATTTITVPTHIHTMDHHHNLPNHSHSNSHNHSIPDHAHYMDHVHNVTYPGSTTGTDNGGYTTNAVIVGSSGPHLDLSSLGHTHGVAAITMQTTGMVGAVAGATLGAGYTQTVSLSTNFYTGSTGSFDPKYPAGSGTTVFIQSPTKTDNTAYTGVGPVTGNPTTGSGTTTSPILPPYQPINFMVRI